MIPWGYKITIYLYVEGEHSTRADIAISASQAAAKAVRDLTTTAYGGDAVVFAGARIDEVNTKPKDQVAS